MTAQGRRPPKTPYRPDAERGGRPVAPVYGTTVTGHRPAFTRRTATEPMMR